jgi:CyaY protein
MTDAEFEQLAQVALEQLRRALELCSAEVEVEEKGDGVLELEFEDGSKMIINRHGAAKEIWVAARAGGFHFRWDAGVWRDAREGSELFTALSRLVSAQGGKPVVLAARSG